jgi:SEC-C motif-containing protein
MPLRDKPHAKPRPCPCFSGLRYAACCRPIHEGARRAETPEALMRSRFAAYALGLGRYLVETLASTHPDRVHGEEVLAQSMSHAKDTQRFLGLEIRETSHDGDRGEVVFHARIFERGVDRSFDERSQFVRENGAWKYASGEVMTGAR